VLDAIKRFFQQFWSQFKPPHWFSWQTLILLSLYSWGMSLLNSVLSDTEFVQDFLATMGWIFLTLGVGWALADVKFEFLGLTIYPGPWITGALTCTFLFEGVRDEFPALSFVSWPLISAAIAAVPKFLKRGPEFKVPDAKGRQELVILFLVSIILSCWFSFHFLLQDWLGDYPSILADRFDKSAFVINTARRLRVSDSRGVLILNLAETIVIDQLEGRSLAETELWLFNVESRVADIETQILQRISSLEENVLWSLEGSVSGDAPRYTLDLRSVWQGPSSYPEGYFLQKSCLITQQLVQNRPAASPPTVSQVACGPISDDLVPLGSITASQGS
jgi:hypothetical protein